MGSPGREGVHRGGAGSGLHGCRLRIVGPTSEPWAARYSARSVASYAQPPGPASTTGAAGAFLRTAAIIAVTPSTLCPLGLPLPSLSRASQPPEAKQAATAEEERPS